MPLDTGAVTQQLLMGAGVDTSEEPPAQEAAIDGALSIGAALHGVRKRQGRTLQDLSDATKIKRSYLEALEEMRLDELPSRPFTIGYVRAYARALGLDGEAAVERFKLDAPASVEPLRPPVGVRKHKDARLSLLAGGGAVVISAVLLWNLAQHAMAEDGPPPPTVVESAATAPVSAAAGVVAISAAQPAPQESTLPTPYRTPGLEVATATSDPSGASAPSGASREVAAAQPAAPSVFTPHGPIYGAAAQASMVTLQARKPALLVIHGPDGSVYFGQQLKAGEAYRAPMAKGLSIDVSEPEAFDVYVNGQIHAPLAASLTPLSQVAAGAATAQAAPAPAAPARQG